MKLWGGRFEKQPSEVFERFSASLHLDRRLLAADVKGSLAYARELERIGVLTAARTVIGRSIRLMKPSASFWS